LNNDIGQWGVIDRHFFSYPVLEKCIYYQVNNKLAEKSYSSKKYFESNYYNTTSK